MLSVKAGTDSKHGSDINSSDEVVFDAMSLESFDTRNPIDNRYLLANLFFMGIAVIPKIIALAFIQKTIAFIATAVFLESQSSTDEEDKSNILIA